MATYDGYDVVLQRQALAQTCCQCDARGLILRDGALYCTGHVPHPSVNMAVTS